MNTKRIFSAWILIVVGLLFLPSLSFGDLKNLGNFPSGVDGHGPNVPGHCENCGSSGDGQTHGGQSGSPSQQIINYPNVIRASDGKLIPANGYWWENLANPSANNYRVVSMGPPGTPYPGYPHVIWKGSGIVNPADGYMWENLDDPKANNFRVVPIPPHTVWMGGKNFLMFCFYMWENPDNPAANHYRVVPCPPNVQSFNGKPVPMMGYEWENPDNPGANNYRVVEIPSHRPGSPYENYPNVVWSDVPPTHRGQEFEPAPGYGWENPKNPGANNYRVLPLPPNCSQLGKGKNVMYWPPAGYDWENPGNPAANRYRVVPEPFRVPYNLDIEKVLEKYPHLRLSMDWNNHEYLTPENGYVWENLDGPTADDLRVRWERGFVAKIKYVLDNYYTTFTDFVADFVTRSDEKPPILTKKESKLAPPKEQKELFATDVTSSLNEISSWYIFEVPQQQGQIKYGSLPNKPLPLPKGKPIDRKHVDNNCQTFFRALGEELAKKKLKSWNKDFPLNRMGEPDADGIVAAIEKEASKPGGSGKWKKLTMKQAQEMADKGYIVIGGLRADHTLIKNKKTGKLEEKRPHGHLEVVVPSNGIDLSKFNEDEPLSGQGPLVRDGNEHPYTYIDPKGEKHEHLSLSTWGTVRASKTVPQSELNEMGWYMWTP